MMAYLVMPVLRPTTLPVGSLLCNLFEMVQNTQLLSCVNYFCFSAARTPLRLKEIQNELNEIAAAEWYQLGIQLEIPVATLRTIEHDHPRDAQRCMTEILNWWLQNTPECSWEKLTEAVEAMGRYRTLVERLRKKTSQG